MGYRYIEVHQYDHESFGAELTRTLDALRREGAEVVSVSMSMALSQPEPGAEPALRRIAQALVWQPDKSRGVTLAALEEAAHHMDAEKPADDTSR